MSECQRTCGEEYQAWWEPCRRRCGAWRSRWYALQAWVSANLAEGHGRFGRDRMQHWRIAYGSAREVDCHLRLLVHAGAIDLKSASKALRLFDEVRAMTWRLVHPKTS